MFHCTNQSNQGNKEEEDSYCNCHSNNSETRDEAKADSPCRNSNQQQAYQLEGRENKKLVCILKEAQLHTATFFTSKLLLERYNLSFQCKEKHNPKQTNPPLHHRDNFSSRSFKAHILQHC